MTDRRLPALSGANSLRPAPASNTILAGALVAAFLPATASAEDAAERASRSDIVVEGHRTGDANPNAVAEAPYKVNRSTDSRITE